MEKINPVLFTLVSVYSGRTGVGLLEEGHGRFFKLHCDYLIFPEIKHYICIFDLLGSTAYLDYLLDLIRSTRIESSSIVWGLGGCKVHVKLEINAVAVRNFWV